MLYLQHGFGENEGSWVWQGRIGWMMDNFLSEKKVTPMLIVMADGMMSEDGDPEKKIIPSLFTKFLTQDLMPYVEAHYRVLTGRENCAQRFPIRKNLPGSGFFPAFCAIISAWRKSRTAI